MTTEQLLMLVLLVVALVFFSFELLAVDVTALLILALLIVFGLIKPQEAFQTFGSETVVVIAGLFVLTRTLLKTGVIEGIGTALQKHLGKRVKWVLRLMLAVIAAVSGFVSNTATAAVFLPFMLSLTHKLNLNPSKTLMPLAFASILGGTITVIGTSTNLVVSGILPKFQQKPFAFFELAWIGVPMTLLGLAYLWFVAPRLLPERSTDIDVNYQLRDYLADLTLPEGHPYHQKTLRETGLGETYQLWVLAVRRGDHLIQSPGSGFVILTGDTLLLEGSSANLMRAKSALGLVTKAEENASPSSLKLVELLVMPRSPLLGRTLKEHGFREKYGCTVLGFHRLQKTVIAPVARTRFQVGDVLLVQGTPEQAERLKSNFVLIDDVSETVREHRKAPLAVLGFLFPILMGAFGWMPFSSAILISVVVMLIFRVISPEESYSTIEWPVLALIAAMLAFGVAFQDTGTAKAIAGLLADWVRPLGPYGILAAFYLLTVVLTQPMSNQAAALVVLPLALGVASELGYNPRTFAIAITIAASNSFITPLEPASLLVFGPGRYKFMDFVKVGLPLTLLAFVLGMVIIPWKWPF
ncbi:SLC13 family permease [Deinococcus roseus]|uniref:SLC13 family permease n=1 Tax=Deinococcus roseus TaxID=392414 RepID=A0ABQ2CZ39_9DEIO|nr:SLC13 family permease [Deinococcus roseus]GGJ35041.1 SLC13 family permease [Deinococcus roseus]